MILEDCCDDEYVLWFVFVAELVTVAELMVVAL